MVFHTKAYGWRDQEPRHYLEEYKNKEFWKYNSEEEHIEVIQQFVDIIKNYGLEVLGHVLIPTENVFSTPETEKKLYESYQSFCQTLRKMIYD